FPTGALVLNPPSFDRFEPAMKKESVLIVNTSLVATQSKRADIRVVYAPANEIASELGAIQLANVVMLGALIEATGMLKFETLDQVLDEHISARHRDKLELNKRALRRGAELARA
ncbi:MAG: 2-oxoacid:acceptor oxidoreductase family protein, partial [Anaerolineales bacterium]|nr:2-oxoacid:acceptor oxidoreductase family protein [Anaerolineales bacterium]